MTSEPTAETKTSADLVKEPIVLTTEQAAALERMTEAIPVFRIGDKVKTISGHVGLVQDIHRQRFVKVSDSEGYHNCESLTLVEPRYTIDQIVDGVTLEWIAEPQGTGDFWGSKKNRVAVKTESGMSRVWEEHGEYWYSLPSSPIHPQVFDYVRCDSIAHGKELCLADYKSRFRAEIERAVKHG